MRKVITIILLIFIPFQQPVLEEQNDVELIIQAAGKQGLELESWEVMMDQKLNRKKFEQILNKLKNNYNITINEEQDKLKYVIRGKKPEPFVDHFLIAIIPKSNQNDITLKLVIKGHYWNKSMKSNYDRLTKRLQFDYDINFGRIFTCLKFNDSVIIRDGLIYEKLQNQLQISHVFKHKDNLTNSTYVAEYYGYSSLFQEEILVGNDQINFQMVIKETAENDSQIIIGTPIVINEY